MSVFANEEETRHLGSQVVGLFRTALRRDPDVHELTEGAGRLRAGDGLTRLAAAIIELPEFQGLYGAASDAELATALFRNVFGLNAPAAAAAALGGVLGASRAELLAGMVGFALSQNRIPLLPGLVPGAPPDDSVAYRLWVQTYGAEQSKPPSAEPGPCFSIALAAGDTGAEWALRTVESLKAQDHLQWRLFLSVRTLSPWTREAVAQACRDETRITPVEPDAMWAMWLADPTSLACLLSPGDCLAPGALHQVAQAFAARPATSLLYTDEDVGTGRDRHSPRFKPAYSPVMAETGLIGQLAVYRPTLLADYSGGRVSPNPAALARHVALAAHRDRILHLPGILCHRAEPPEPVMPPARPCHAALDPAPGVTVIVPTRDRASLLQACMDGLLHRTDYPALDVLVVDNDSTESEAVTLLATLARTPRVRVLSHPGAFNFAAMNNAAAIAATGKILLLLNNDTEILHPDWLTEMVCQLAVPGVGAVGARLLYPSGTVQHAGLLLGPEGRATHVGRGASASDPGYLGQLACARDVSAVTGACLGIPAAVWHQVGGMDERLAVTWNDVDLCLRVREAGLRVVWTPHATLTHKEAMTRGLEADDPMRAARFRAEQALVQSRWGDAVEHDPFLNPNLVVTDAGTLCLAPPRQHPLVSGPGTADHLPDRS